MGEFPSKRDKDLFIQGREEENGYEEKSGERARRDNKRANVSFHEGGLLDCEGTNLRVDSPEEDTSGPDGNELENHFHLFNLGDCGYYPRVVFVLTTTSVVVQNRSFIQTPKHSHAMERNLINVNDR